MPVIPATRAERRSASARWPRVPAERRITDTAAAARPAAMNASVAPSRVQVGSDASAAASEPAASARKIPRISQP